MNVHDMAIGQTELKTGNRNKMNLTHLLIFDKQNVCVSDSQLFCLILLTMQTDRYMTSAISQLELCLPNFNSLVQWKFSKHLFENPRELQSIKTMKLESRPPPHREVSDNLACSSVL